MKNKISVMLVALVLISGAARAQWPVTDLAIVERLQALFGG